MSGSWITRSRATMLVAVGAMAFSVVSPGGAQGAPAAPEKCTIKSYTPAKFAVAATDTERQFRIKTTGCKQKNWRVELVVENTAVLLASKALPVTRFVPKELDNSLAGSYPVVVTVKSTDDVVTKKKFTFSLLRMSTFGKSFNAGPEPTRQGATLKLVGKLKRVSWGENPSYGGYANRTVQVQFKAAGTTTFKNVKSAKTDAAGSVATTVIANKSGTWRLHFAGNATTSAANSVVDGVRVD